MYKTILAVVAFLFVALAAQLYEQDRIQARIVKQQQDAEKAQADIQARADDAERNRQIAAGIHPELAPATDILVPETFSVPNGAPKEFSISVDTSRMMDVAIAGHFAVAGDHNSGVEVYVFDEDDYTNWLYGNNANAIYSSGQESTGDVRARIARSGRYFLVFRNSASSTSVNVKADIKMQYEKIASTSS